MTPLNGNNCRDTGHLCGKLTGHRWIPRIKAQWRGTLMFSLICVWINGRVKNREIGDLRRHRTHYDVTVVVVKTLHQNVHYCDITMSAMVHVMAFTTRQQTITWASRGPYKYLSISAIDIGFRHTSPHIYTIHDPNMYLSITLLLCITKDLLIKNHVLLHLQYRDDNCTNTNPSIYQMTI